MMTEYPKVADEFTTLFKLHAGYSIARFGDGELKILDGKGYGREPANEELTAELRRALTNPHTKCMIGIPTMDPKGPKYANWLRHEARFMKYLTEHRQYYSAFISRPDSAPWIGIKDFALLFRHLWARKSVAVVSEPTNSALRLISKTARNVHHIPCPSLGAFKNIDAYEQEVFNTSPDIAFMSCGPTASCLANRLATRGIQVIDLGSAGGFLSKLLKSE